MPYQKSAIGLSMWYRARLRGEGFDMAGAPLLAEPAQRGTQVGVGGIQGLGARFRGEGLAWQAHRCWQNQHREGHR